MKKVFILVTIIGATLSFTACKKNYMCECEKSNNKVESYTVTATNKIEAQKNCDEHGLAGECELK